MRVRTRGLNMWLNYLTKTNELVTDEYKLWGESENSRTFRENTGNIYKFEEILSYYIYQNNINLNDNNQYDTKLKEVLKSSGMIPIDNSFKFIMLKNGNLFDYFTKVNATIIFRGLRPLHFYPNYFRNVKIEYFSLVESSWIGDIEIFNDTDLENNILYKITKYDTNEISYVTFIDTNYENGTINIEEFVSKRIDLGINFLKELLGSIFIETIAMSFTFMNNLPDEANALPIMIKHLENKLMNDNFLKKIILIDYTHSFAGFYKETIYKTFEIV